MAEELEEDVFEDSDSYESLVNEEGQEEQEKLKKEKEIKVRVDQYLTTSKLGRLAFLAGDVQLAKDRFNLAMNLEFLTEMESSSDFGVTGGMLRDDLLTRTETTADVASISDRRLTEILSKLRSIFVRADDKAALNTADVDSFLVMGAALSMIGEWDKAEAVYKEGLAGSPKGSNNHKLVDALKRLNNLRDTIKLVSSEKNTSSTLQRTRKSNKRPKSVFFLSEDAPVTRSRSFSSELDSAGKLNSPFKDTPPPSPLVGMYSPQPKRKGLQRLFKKDKWRPKSLFLNNNGMSFSSSFEDLQDNGVWRKRSTWKSVFDFDHVKQSLEEFESRTVQTMRVLNYCTSQRDDHAL